MADAAAVNDGQLAEKLAGALKKVEDLTGNSTKIALLNKTTNFENVNSWVKILDDDLDGSLIIKLNNLDVDHLEKLDFDLSSNSMGSSLKSLLKEDPDDLENVWKVWRDSKPAVSAIPTSWKVPC